MNSSLLICYLFGRNLCVCVFYCARAYAWDSKLVYNKKRETQNSQTLAFYS